MKYIPKILGLEFAHQIYLKKENKIKNLLEFLKKGIECQERNKFLTDRENTIKKPNQYTHNFRRKGKIKK